MTGAAGTSVEIRIVWIDIPADVNYQDRGLAALSSCVCTPKIIDTSQLNVLAEVMYGKDKTIVSQRKRTSLKIKKFF